MNGPFRAERKKKFLTPFWTYLHDFGEKIFFMKISENPGPLPGGEFFFSFFFSSRRFTFPPPPPKLALGLQEASVHLINFSLNLLDCEWLGVHPRYTGHTEVHCHERAVVFQLYITPLFFSNHLRFYNILYLFSNHPLQAIVENDFGKFKRVVTEDPSKMHARDHFGATPLLVCVLLNNIITKRIARWLLSRNPQLAQDMYTTDFFKGELSLHFAITNRDMDMTRLLLDHHPRGILPPPPPCYLGHRESDVMFVRALRGRLHSICLHPFPVKNQGSLFDCILFDSLLWRMPPPFGTATFQPSNKSCSSGGVNYVFPFRSLSL